MRLTSSDLQRISEVLRQLYGQTDAARLPHTILNCLSKLIACEHISYNEIDSRTNAVMILMDHHVPEVYELLPAFEAHLPEHPHFEHYRTTKDRQAYKTTDFVTQREFKTLSVYTEFYRHVSTKLQLACFLSDPGVLEIGIALNRNGRDFGNRERACLELLRPHILQAHRNAAAYTEAQRKFKALSATLDGMKQGLIELDNTNRITWLTPNAVKLLQQYFGQIAAGRNRLPASLDRWLSFKAAKVTSGEIVTTAMAPMVIHRGDSRLVVRFLVEANQGRRLLLTEEVLRLRSERAQELGLTSREAEVLHWITEGKSNPEIGLILGISARTVHKHVERILGKLGVENRITAIRVALGVLQGSSIKM